MRTRKELRHQINLPFEVKEQKALRLISEFIEYYDSYVSVSGGLDSTVLLDLVRRVDNRVPGVFVDTGLEFPENRNHVKALSNIEWLKPKMSFRDVINTYGYPVISKEQSQFIYEYKTTYSPKLRNIRLEGNSYGRGKISKKYDYLLEAPFMVSHKCCDVLKKEPIKNYERETERKPFIGTMAMESELRVTSWLKNGCNSFESKRVSSRPLSTWTKQDIWKYVRKYNLDYSKVYDKGFSRTGCIFCMFGIQHDKGQNRFQKLSKTHPKQYRFCVDDLGCGRVLDYIGINY